MRSVPVPAALACGALLLAAGCAQSAAGERPPGVPSGVTADAGSATSVHVMWNRVLGEPPVTAYEVYRGGTKVKEVPAGEHMVDVARLRPGTSYVFTVRARDGRGRLGPPSRPARATTPRAVARDTAAPSRPGSLRGRAVGSRAAQLTWTASSDDQKVVSYDVYQGGAKIHSVGGSQTAAVITGLRPGTRYAFSIRARDAADNLSPASATARLTTAPGADTGGATAPGGFRASTHAEDGAYYVDLSWTVPETDGVVTEYQIRLDGLPATSLVFGGRPPEGRATHSFYVGREAGQEHRVRLRARLPDGTWGALSPERTVTTGTDG